jgi:hypothetical protein
MGVYALKPVTLTASTVVLPSATWREELAAELVLLGLTPEAADTGALHALQHVVARAGWPSAVFEIAPNPAPDQREGEL